uniref:Uncharacterized protein n=1 Tax=Arundo donax TaxID=35708 RepID=A0A0A9FIA3_ARUDO
MYNSLRARS